tara:strand:- start:13442 stop:14017 length:576 start_codon:yes stop_codon:yes gene_type:complete
VKKIEITSALIGDVALPLAGFFFWDWGFYFIALFFLFDISFRSIFLNKRVKLLPSMVFENRFVLKGVLLTVFEILALHILVILSISSIDFVSEFWSFLTYQEIGVAQGVVLLPLLILNEFMRIRNEQKMKVPQHVRFDIMINSQKIQLFRVLLWCLFMGLTMLIPFHETALVLIFIATLSIQPFWIYRNIS